ncbi:MAG TPA: hypothetical protein VLE99_03975 [Candidatus Saccharimonadales bacterium]|nr:hypothetical protein [Candidatus Saccharimonadales bacterium]
MWSNEIQRSIVRWSAVACASFVVLMCTVCMVLDPALFKHPHWGLSFYGYQKSVWWYYYGGFAIVVGCLARMTSLLWNVVGRWRPLRLVFLGATLCSLGIAVTSSMQGAFLFWSHMSFCLALVLVLLPAEVWIVRCPGSNWVDWVGLVGIVTGTALLLLSANWIRAVLGIYYWAEVVFFLSALLALTRAAFRATASDVAKA